MKNDTEFVHLAEGRTQAALNTIGKIGNLSNRRLRIH